MTIDFTTLCNCPAGVTSYAGLLGFWPLNGMGTFNSSASLTSSGGWGLAWNFVPNATSGANTTAMDDLWPNVYRTLTLTFTATTGDLVGTPFIQVYQYQDYCDQPVLVTTTTPPNWRPPFEMNGSPTYSPTQISCAYTYGPPQFGLGGGVGIFTATLSNQFNASAGWAALAANAAAWVTATNLSGLSPSTAFFTKAYYPVSPSYSSPAGTSPVPYAIANLEAGYACAAAIGMPTRDPSFPPALAFRSVYPDLPAIYDFDTPASTPPARNFGGVICLASNWVLTGTAPGITYTPATDHKTIYAQEFQLAAFKMGNILQPWPSMYADDTAILQDPHAYPNPIVPVLPVSFLPDDVLANLAAGGNTGALYGILGFNPQYAGAGQVWIGAFASTNLTGPGAGGGTPPV